MNWFSRLVQKFSGKGKRAKKKPSAHDLELERQEKEIEEGARVSWKDSMEFHSSDATSNGEEIRHDVRKHRHARGA